MNKLVRFGLTKIRAKIEIETDREDDIREILEMAGAVLMLLWWPFQAAGRFISRVSWRVSDAAGLLDFTVKVIAIHLTAYAYGLLWPYWLARLVKL